MKFVINAPHYNHRSSGIRVLYLLHDMLVKAEHRCRVVLKHEPGKCTQDEIAIYPEIITGNPLNATKVIRWCLNQPGVLGGETKYDFSELVFYYVDWIKDAAEKAAGKSCQRFCLISFEQDLFFDSKCNKSGALLYVGKGELKLPLPEKVFEIKRDFSPDRKTFAELLQRSKTFYCCDDHTAASLEASACGCTILQQTNVDWVPAKIDLEAYRAKYLYPNHNKDQLADFLQTVEKVYGRC